MRSLSPRSRRAIASRPQAGSRELQSRRNHREKCWAFLKKPGPCHQAKAVNSRSGFTKDPHSHSTTAIVKFATQTTLERQSRWRTRNANRWPLGTYQRNISEEHIKEPLNVSNASTSSQVDSMPDHLVRTFSVCNSNLWIRGFEFKPLKFRVWTRSSEPETGN